MQIHAHWARTKSFKFLKLHQGNWYVYDYYSAISNVWKLKKCCLVGNKLEFAQRLWMLILACYDTAYNLDLSYRFKAPNIVFCGRLGMHLSMCLKSWVLVLTLQLTNDLGPGTCLSFCLASHLLSENCWNQFSFHFLVWIGKIMIIALTAYLKLWSRYW